MRRLILATLAVALIGLSGLAMAAAARQGKGEFSPLASSGISGRVRLTGQTEKQQTHVVLQVKGLQDAQYMAVAYTNNNCSTDAQAMELGRFKPKTSSGMTTWSGRINRNVDQIGSISLQLVSDQSVQACAAIVIQ